MGDGVDVDGGMDVVMSAGDEVWVAVGVEVGDAAGVGVAACFDVEVEFRRGFSKSFGDVAGSGLESILDILFLRS
jgi:hypothetical protein